MSLSPDLFNLFAPAPVQIPDSAPEPAAVLPPDAPKDDATLPPPEKAKAKRATKPKEPVDMDAAFTALTGAPATTAAQEPAVIVHRIELGPETLAVLRGLLK